jgi:hypothetical protein
MNVYFGFSYRKAKFSKFLRWAEKRPYSHCYVKYVNHVTKKPLILHAAVLSVHTLSTDRFYNHGNRIVKEYVISVDDPQKVKDIIGFIQDMSGADYGWKQLFGMCIARTAAFFGIKIKNPFADQLKTLVCSEYCAKLANLTGKISIDMDYAEIGGPSWLDKEFEKASIPFIVYNET